MYAKGVGGREVGAEREANWGSPNAGPDAVFSVELSERGAVISSDIIEIIAGGSGGN